MSCIYKDKKAKLIQNWYIKEKAKSAYKIINKIIDDLENNIEFEKFTNIIQKKSIIKGISWFLRYISKDKFIDSKKFITIFVIHKYHEIVMGTDEENAKYSMLKSELCDLADSLFEQLKITQFNNLNLTDLNNKLIKYNYLFNKWKNDDLNSIINILCYSYTELDETYQLLEKTNIDNEEYNEFKLNIENQKKQIVDYIQKLDAVDQFNNYKAPKIEYDDKFKEHVKQTMEKAYWDIMTQELKEDPIKFNSFIKLIKDIKTISLQIVKSNKKLMKEIIDSIDIVNFIQLAENDAIDNSTIKNKLLYITSFLKRIQSPSMDVSTDKIERKIITNFDTNEPLYTFLPECMKYLIHSYEEILVQVNEFLERKDKENK